MGHILDALFAANLNGVFGAVALKALEVYALSTPWLHQDTTTIALYGAYADEPQAPGAPRPADGHSKDGRADLKQVGSLVIPGIHNSVIFRAKKECPYKSSWIL